MISDPKIISNNTKIAIFCIHVRRFLGTKGFIVRDPDYFTRTMEKLAYNSCNLNLRQKVRMKLCVHEFLRTDNFYIPYSNAVCFVDIFGKVVSTILEVFYNSVNCTC